MTLDEIKSTITMEEVLSSYGVKVRNGMCSCPFHGRDKHPSMKVFKDGANCFTCHWNGTVIDAVMQFENCDFKTAYYKLGGTYERHSDKERRLATHSRERVKTTRERQERAVKDFKSELAQCIGICRQQIKELPPLSDGWCFFQNKLPCLVGAWEEKYINSGEVNEIDVLRICRQVRREINSITRSNG